ncbi:hydrolase [Serratia microhaemolytica]|uniref:hydrolase n=1 Tax=Serratia microhaemolytica TaxID=2675110 RepID=UPI000FDD8455|nr:hydrolase [Serratia microhaemolytica]
MYKIRTVDVWDTLLRRDCHPECIKLATARHLFLGWFKQLKPEYRDVWSLYKVRIESEQVLAMNSRAVDKDDEYEINEVLSHWLTVVFFEEVGAELASYLAEFEFSVEIARSFVDPEISFFLHTYQAENTFFLSDFYMNAEMLQRLLSAKGLDALVKGGFSSCDVGLNKRSGRIFSYVHRSYSVTPEQHLHIGDNEWSDVSCPQSLGINAVHYQPILAHSDRLAREHLFLSRDILFEHLTTECSALAKEASVGLLERQAAALSLGVDAAPLFIGFVIWIAEQAVLENLDRLYFFTREGEFFYQIFSILFPENKFCGHVLPPSSVLAVSRLSTFLPSMQEISIEEMTRLWSLFKVQSVSGLFLTLRVDIKDFDWLLDELCLKPTDAIIDPENSQALRNLFESKIFKEAVKSSLNNQSALLRSYLIQNGFELAQRVGAVDIGWRGTIQDNIAKIMNDNQLHGMYLGLRKLINRQPENVSKVAFGINENNSEGYQFFFENFAVLEMLCGSPHGSVSGYELKDGIVIPIRELDKEENLAYDDFIEFFQRGVLLAAKQWKSYLERYVVSSSELNGIALCIWNTLRRTPDKHLVDVFLATPQNDVFGYGEIFRRNQYPSLKTILLATFLPSKRQQLVEFIRRVQWTQAIKNAKGISVFHRVILLLLFRAAHLVKFLRLRMKFRKK